LKAASCAVQQRHPPQRCVALLPQQVACTCCAAAELKELLSLLDSSDVSDPNFDGRLQDIMEVRATAGGTTQDTARRIIATIASSAWSSVCRYTYSSIMQLTVFYWS
jgi:hypothetical protein